MGGEGRWEGKAGRKFSRYTVYIEQATTFDEARRPTSARILAIFAVHRPVPRQRVARFTFRTYLATKPSHRFLRFNVSIPLKFLSKDALRFYYNISFFLSRILCSQARFLDSIDISEVANFYFFVDHPFMSVLFLRENF